MPTNKRITDLTDYTSVLPYASEMFGVYQPMLGWKSKRITKRFNQTVIDKRNALLQAYAKHFSGISQTNFIQCDAEITVQVGTLRPIRLIKNTNSILLQNIALPKDRAPEKKEWKEFINKGRLEEILNSTVKDFYRNSYHHECAKIPQLPLTRVPLSAEIEAYSTTSRSLQNNIIRLLNEESALAGALLAMVGQNMLSQLESIFYETPIDDLTLINQQIADMISIDDPFATFDPKRDIKNVSLSPLGIVHLFRQYFFELDTFLGTPIGHVWLSPGSTVELLEVSTRKELIEKTSEQSTETTHKRESSSTDRDEFSEAIKEDNKTDLKLGASLTVNQSWGTGDATATGSLSMENTQSTARENTFKRMHEQAQKLSSEIKQNYKSTFKTVTETTDVSSKRYVLANSTEDLINYELRRKMRQVGVQVQDIGTYLCWQTYVDEPGKALGLANLVNIAKPADLVDVPEPTEMPPPSDKSVPFTANVQWNFTDNSRQFNNPDGFLPITTIDTPPAPQGYEVKFENGYIGVFQVSATGEDFSGVWGFKGKLIGKSKIALGPIIAAGGMAWDNVINFVVGGVVEFTPNDATKKAVADANAQKLADKTKATNANVKQTAEALLNAAKERIEIASNIKSRKYEDLREEERIIVYRNLIGALMSDTFYGMPENKANDETRHILSELINSIFDIDKMLYFVAPEWWKPRHHYSQSLGSVNAYDTFIGNLTSWSDLEIRDDNYFITENSQYAKLGSSLGWLLQLDGDDMRNAFLNAPWVKAVIPIRPGKELEANNWLQQMQIEGTDGLDSLYHGQEEELDKIKATLKIADVTIADAIKFLCAEVAAKHKDSLKVARYPKEEISDDNRVSATPINKVYEHGFYPLKDGFRALTSESYEVFDQWIEVLPTDQVVPVEVKYDPRTGRQQI